MKMPIGFPTLICGMIHSQHPGILNNLDIVSEMESLLSLHYKLFIGTHVLDIVTISRKKATNLASKERTIAELQETCDDLINITKRSSERKIILKNLMRALKEDKDVIDEDKNNKDAEEENDGRKETREEGETNSSSNS